MTAIDRYRDTSERVFWEHAEKFLKPRGMEMLSVNLYTKFLTTGFLFRDWRYMAQGVHEGYLTDTSLEKALKKAWENRWVA